MFTGSGADYIGLRQRLSTDPHRPLYHFLPPANWMNDPNGLCHHDGVYHLFYQHNPLAAVWGNMTWGHSVSPDLVHWSDLPPALQPNEDYDRGGVFSGCLVNDHGMAAVLYTGVQPEVQCLATSRDLIQFRKYAGNPVIAGPPPGLNVTGFRDPFVWRQDDTWRMVVGSGLQGVGGAILLYESKDLKHWEYIGVPFIDKSGETGEMWECPNLFQLGDQWVLIVSTLGRAIYFVGDFHDGRFQPKNRGEVDPGGVFYAPQTFLDESGRRIILGWLPERRNTAAEYGWQGVMSLPRLVGLGHDGELTFVPVPEVETLRKQRYKYASRTVATGTEWLVPEPSGDGMEIAAKVEPGRVGRCSLILRSRTGEEETVVFYDRDQGILGLDLNRASLDTAAVGGCVTVPLVLEPSETLELRVFLDRSIIEVFANRRVCLTGRIYPCAHDGLSVVISSRDGDCAVKALDIWTMQAIWPEGHAESAIHCSES